MRVHAKFVLRVVSGSRCMRRGIGNATGRVRVGEEDACTVVLGCVWAECGGVLVRKDCDWIERQLALAVSKLHLFVREAG